MEETTSAMAVPVHEVIVIHAQWFISMPSISRKWFPTIR